MPDPYVLASYTPPMIAWCSLILVMPLIGLILAAWHRYLARLPETNDSLAAVCGIALPLLASAGFLGLLWDREGVVGTSGALVLGSGPLICGLVTGTLLVTRPDAHETGRSSSGLIMFVAGLVMVMIAAAGRVPHTVGLIACTIGLVLIWRTSLRSRDGHRQVRPSDTPQQPLSLTVALAGSLILAFCTRLSPIEWMPLVIVVLVVGAVVMLHMLMSSRGVFAALEAAWWFAIILPCLGLGLLGQDRLAVLVRGHDLPGLPAVVPTLRSTEGLVVPGVVLMLSVVFWLLAGSVASSWRRTLGVCLIVVGVLGFLDLGLGHSG